MSFTNKKLTGGPLCRGNDGVINNALAIIDYESLRFDLHDISDVIYCN